MNGVVCARFISSLFTLFQKTNIPVYQPIQIFSFRDKIFVNVIRNVTDSICMNYVTQRFFKRAAGDITKSDIILKVKSSVTLSNIRRDALR